MDRFSHFKWLYCILGIILRIAHKNIKILRRVKISRIFWILKNFVAFLIFDHPLTSKSRIKIDFEYDKKFSWRKKFKCHKFSSWVTIVKKFKVKAPLETRKDVYCYIVANLFFRAGTLHKFKQDLFISRHTVLGIWFLRAPTNRVRP